MHTEENNLMKVSECNRVNNGYKHHSVGNNQPVGWSTNQLKVKRGKVNDMEVQK